MDENLFRGIAAVIRENNEDVDRKISVVKRQVKAELTSALSRDFSNELIKDFKESRSYVPGDMVRLRGGVFQAWTDTDQHPLAKDSGWVCLVNGVSEMELKAVGHRGRVLAVEMADGSIVQHSWKEPMPLHKGTWELGKSFEEADEVMWGGSTWRCLVDKTIAEPGTSPDWQMIAQRGKPGKSIQGDAGVPGEKGDKGEDASPVTAAKMVMRSMISELKGIIDARS